MKRVGFIGLGNMGTKMALNLLKANFDVVGYDVNTKSIEELVPYGLKQVPNLNSFPVDLDVIITMLPNGKIVKEVYRTIIKNFKENTLFVDCSTINVNEAQIIHKMCRENKILSLDAPVSGGVIGAENATLTFMVGGADDTYKLMLPLFDVMGNKSVLCGLPSAGQAAKACNNMLLAITMIGVGEAFNLGNNLGLEADKLYDVLSTSSGSCWAINSYCPIEDVGPQSPADNDFKPGFSAQLMLKDLTIALKSIEETGSLAPFGSEAQRLFKKMIDNNKGDLDFSAIVNLIK